MSKVKRHGFAVRFVHWTVALSTFLLIFTGFGQMPMYTRYRIVNIPGLAWSGDFSITLLVHYIAAVVLIFAVTYHIVYHLIRKEFDIFPRKGDIKKSYQIIKAMITKGKEPENDKYLAEQRLAYAYIGVMLLVIIITGMIKVYKNLQAVTLNASLLVWATDIHTAAAVLLLMGIVGHLLAFVFKENRPLIPGIFTGKVDEEYAKRRHSIWYQKLNSKNRSDYVGTKDLQM